MSETQKVNILVVDDTRANLRLLVEILSDQGYKARPVQNGERALLSACTVPPDLILLDINMPGMNGYEVCEQLKANERTREIPVIFISALNELLDKVRGFAVGGVDYITKPFQVEEVLARVETHLTLRRLQVELKKKNDLLEKEIIERKRAEEAANIANQAKSMFLANMSHELRSPLNAILGFAQIMRRSRELPKQQLENVGIISRSGEHLLQLINNVLDLSKIEAGKTTLNEKNFDLYRLLSDLEDMFHLKADDKRLHLLFEHTQEVPQYVRTDDVKLRQVLINLLNNAIKYTDEGGISVRVGTISAERERAATAATCKLRFEIEDTGPGIAGHEIKRLFEPFMQTEAGISSEEGTGLGLPISRQFVRLMGGEMSVESQVGRGSIFMFNISITPVNKNNIKQKQATRRIITLEPNPSFGRRYRILIVDDRWDNRQLLIRLLNPLGFSLQEASNGQEAIEIWQAWEPDLIWMDMRMPVMNGIEATKRIKETTKGQATPIIALTASTFEEERALVLEAGCDDFLRKPFRDTDIFDLMHKHIKVRYIYDEPTSAHHTNNQKVLLTATLLKTLPAKLLSVLQEATEGSDIEMMEQVLIQISRHNPTLANQLTSLASNFEYDEILQLIEGAKVL